MIPILFRPEADPEALLDVNSIPLQDVNAVELLAAGDTSTARSFNTYGQGALTDCISCQVTEERNGEYELVMEYPMTGVHFDEIEVRSIIWAKPNYTDSAQAFRVYEIDSPIDGVCEIFAQHISYDLSGIPVLPFTATSCSAACAGLINNAAVASPFTVGTQIGTIADFSVDVPSSVRSWFGGKEGSLIDTYGGEWWYDNYTCTLKSARGQNRGVVIKYGVNLIDVHQEENIANTWTGVLPYWQNIETGKVVKASIINVAGNYDYRRILCLDMSLDFEGEPTRAQLKAKAQTYITANNIGVPNVNITLDWAQTTEQVELCDTVTVEFEKLGISTTAKCISTTWDVLKDRYSKIEFGDVTPNIATTIAGLQDTEKTITTSVTPSMLRAINNATALITGNEGGYVILHDGDGDGYPDELLVMNTPDVSTSTRIWRWNQAGLGYSSSGYSGTFGLAMTANGEIVADYITTGTLSADRINGGTITGVAINNGSNTFKVDANGNLTASSATITGGAISGTTLNIGSGAFQVDANGNLTASKAAITGGYITLDTQNISQGLTLQNTAGTTKTELTASSLKRTVSGTVVLNILNGALTANSTITFPNVYSTTNSGGGYVRVLDAGTLCRYVSSSTRYKHDITAELDEENDPLRLLELEPKQFKYNDDYLDKNDQRYGQNVLGFIAEEVAEVMPGAVDYDSEGRPEMWNVHVIVPALLGIVKKQQKEIDELKARMDLLEAHFLGGK